MKLMKKQSTLFPEDSAKILAELDLKEAERLADQLKAAVEAQCERIEVAGSIRRQKTKVHDIDFVVVTKNDVEWQKISEKLKHLKAKPNCQETASSKHFCPAKTAFSKWTSTVQNRQPSAFTCLSALARLTITCGLPATPFQKG